MQQARLIRQIDGYECERRNALTNRPADLALPAGSLGIVVERLDNGTAYLVEFGNRSADQCDWLGVLYASEVQLLEAAAQAA